MVRRTAIAAWSSLLALCLVGDLGLHAASPQAPADSTTAAAASGAIDRAAYDQMVSRAIEFLSARQQDNGAFSPETGPGVTALVTTAILRHGRSPDDPMVARALKYIESCVQPDGGIHAPDSRYRNYETCLAVLCLSEANRDGRYQAVLQRADAFLKGLQWDQGEGIESSDPAFGGAGYGTHKRPDLSNTSFLMDALRALGNEADDEAVQRALIFVSRCQNLDTPHNDTEFAGKVQDGGFYYTIAAGGSSQAGTLPNGGLRSYGSMTYAGLKSMIYAGVDSSDPRVEAALQWIGKHYRLDANPGMGAAGLYYYYHTFAKALDALGTDVFVDAQGQTHRWRDELNAELARRQQPDGSWVNENERWLEANPDLVTGYVLLALSYSRPGDR